MRREALPAVALELAIRCCRVKLDPLEVAGLRFAIGEQPAEDLPYIAADALVRGVDSPLLREAAGASPTNWWQSRDAFFLALDQLGLSPGPDPQVNLWRLVRDVAQRIVDGEVAP